MAYPTIDAPYGYKPVSLIGGQPFAGSTRNLPISYNYGTAIYAGDMVTLSSGYVVLATYPVSTTNTTVGVFMGCYYTNPTTKQRLFSQFYPGNITAGDITAIVCDDPDAVFKCAVVASAASATIASGSSILVGQNLAGTTLTGSASTGNAAAGVVALTTNTSGGGFRVMGLVPDTQVTTGAAYVSGTGTTTLTVSGLTVGQVLPIGTDVYNLVNGQMQFTGSSLTAAATVTSATSQALTVVASGVTVTGNLVLVQSPEVLVKLNFGAHRYLVA